MQEKLNNLSLHAVVAASLIHEHLTSIVCRAAGIALLVVILVALLILGCWYFKRRSGYKMIRVMYKAAKLPWLLS